MSNSKTFDPKEIFGNAFAEAEAPDGYIVTDHFRLYLKLIWKRKLKLCMAA